MANFVMLLKNKEYSNLKGFKNLRKEKFLVFFSFTAIFLFVVFGIMEYVITGHLTMVFLLFTSSFLLLSDLIFFSLTKNMKISSSIVILICMCLMIYTFIDSGFGRISMIWILVFPLIAYYFKGKIVGSIHIGILIFAGLLIFSLSLLNIIPINYTKTVYLLIICVMIIISLMTLFYEDTFSKSEKNIIRQIYTDSLTGLQNRKKLVLDISMKDTFRLILINVDDFKEINDIYGNKLGDDIIQEISVRILNLIGDEKRIYKLHADEFAVLLEDSHNINTVIDTIKNIDLILSTDFFIKKHEITISVTMGISNIGFDILSEADIALKQAKEKRVAYLFFDKTVSMKERYRNNLALLKKLKKGIANDNIVPFYQPIINNKTLKIEKYECLIRLFYENEIITPLSFIDLAKRSKVYPHITRIIILKAFEYFKDKEFEFSINLSIDDILNKDTVKFIYDSLTDYKNTKNVVFEIVESEKIDKYEEIIDFIEAVKKHGCKIAIDDFGSGYSNFEYILRMNVDYLKIDSSLIKKIDCDSNSMTIIETISDFCRKLNLKTIAEFVHSESVYMKVKELEIDYSQGFYFGEPTQDI